jgi:hypothetical protein
MSGTSSRDLRRSLDSGSALSDIRDADRKMSADRDFSEQRLYHTDL